MIRLLLFLAFFIVNFQVLNAQEVELEMDVDEQYKGTHGPNMRHYGHFFIGLGVVPGIGEKEGVQTDFGASSDFLFGYRYKLKLASFYAIGMEASLKGTRYGFSDDGKNPLNPDNPLTFPQEEKRHFLQNTSAGLGIYQRINIGRRGNSLGNYLDAGANVQWNYMAREVVVYKSNADFEAAKDSRLIYRGLEYVEPFTYGVFGRIGIGRYSIYAEYRLSSYFNDKWTIPGLTELTAGFRIAL